MTTCPACNRPLEPGIFECRTYHSGFDPQGRVEMLERRLKTVMSRALEAQLAFGDGLPRSPEMILREITAICSAALEYRPAQMKGRE